MDRDREEHEQEARLDLHFDADDAVGADGRGFLTEERDAGLLCVVQDGDLADLRRLGRRLALQKSCTLEARVGG